MPYLSALSRPPPDLEETVEGSASPYTYEEASRYSI